MNSPERTGCSTTCAQRTSRLLDLIVRLIPTAFARPAKQADADLKRDLEHWLRGRGFSRSQAKAAVSAAFKVRATP